MDNRQRLNRAYLKLDRKDFIDDFHAYASKDRPLPIGQGQTISQPSLVLKMSEMLDINAQDKVLELGTGSGFQTALLAEVGHKIYTVERIESLLTKAKHRLKNLGYTNIEYRLGDGHMGWDEYAPYDRIMVTAAAKTVPKSLMNQLALGGKMMIPVDNDRAQDLLLVEKSRSGEIQKTMIEKVRFVPLVKD